MIFTPVDFKPSISDSSRRGDESRPSSPTAQLAVFPYFKEIIVPNDRPIAIASEESRVSPKVPRISY